MKKFIKFIVTILVVCIIGSTLYFVLKMNSDYQSSNSSGDNLSGDTLLENTPSGELNEEVDNNLNVDENINNTENNSNENIENPEKTQVLTIEEKENKIKEIENQNRTSNLTKTLEDNVGIDVMGTKNTEFLESTGMDAISINVQVAGTMVYIIPAPDFIDNAQYHYDENGNLVLYICELTGIGGEIRYYFENGNLLSQSYNVEEGAQINFENAEEIIQRANIIYEKYMKNI